MTRRVNLDQWTDRTEPPVIVWVYCGYWELEPVAVNDTNENDLYAEYAAAWYAAHAYQTAEEVEEEFDNYSIGEIWRAYGKGDGTAENMGLPREYYVEGAAEDSSDLLIYVDEETVYNTRRESLEDAAAYLYPEDVAEIYREVLAAREDR